MKKKYDLYTNICKEYISKGYEYQEEFRKEYVPIFKYKIDTTEITKKYVWSMVKIQLEFIIK